MTKIQKIQKELDGLKLMTTGEFAKFMESRSTEKQYRLKFLRKFKSGELECIRIGKEIFIPTDLFVEQN
jgi:hypothetical protein